MSGWRRYLRDNLLAGLRTPPWPLPLAAVAPVPLFAAAALAIGHYGGLFEPGVVESRLLVVMPLTLLVFPSLLEEAVFRGLLIPRGTRGRGPARTAAVLGGSTAAFVLWHPLNALTVNPGARTLFLDPAFLAITALLGLTCGHAYLVSRSLWLPVVIHWLTVLVWVLFLGGRNLLLAP